MATVLSNISTTADDATLQIEQGLRSSHEKVLTSRYTAAGALADNTVIIMGEIPVEAKITSIRMWSDDMGTTGDTNVGFYPGNIKATDVVIGDAVDEDALGTAIDINAAATANVEVRFETKNFTTLDDKAWELAGLSTKPDYGTFHLAFTLSEATTAAGDLALIVRYTE